MTDFVLALPLADVPDPLPLPSLLYATWNDGADQVAYMYTSDEVDPLPAWPVGTAILGAWNGLPDGLQYGEFYNPPGVVDGTPFYPIQQDYWDYVNLLGNEGGVATGPLRSTQWQGHAPEKFAVTDQSEYPVADAPFTIKLTREDIGADAPEWSSIVQYFTGDYSQSPLGTTWQASQDSLNETPFGGSPFWDFVNTPGWGWRAEVISEDPLRDITARAIAIYTDPAWTAFLYTSGAFTLDPGTGLYTSLSPPGQRTATPTDTYYSLLWGSLQEGNWQQTDPDAGAVEDRLHWMLDQGAAAAMGTVQDVGGESQMAAADYSTLVYSPDGHQVIDLDSITASRLVILLAGGAQDTLNPTLTIWLPTGPVVIPFTWQAAMSRYRSGIVANIRDDILANTGYKLAFDLTWS